MPIKFFYVFTIQGNAKIRCGLPCRTTMYAEKGRNERKIERKREKKKEKRNKKKKKSILWFVLYRELTITISVVLKHTQS